MSDLIIPYVIQISLLLLLLKKEINNGEKELFKKQKWSTCDLVLTLVLIDSSIFLFLLVGLLLMAFKIDIYSISVKIDSLLVYAFQAAIILLLFRFRFRQGVEIIGITKGDLRKKISWGVFYAIICFLIVNSPYLLLGIEDYYPGNIKGIKDISSFIDISLYLLAGIILAPVVEEIVYRGILYSPFRKRFGSKGAIIITSMMFALVHSAIAPFVLGLVLSILYEKTESIVSTIVAHSVYNLLAFFATYYVFAVVGVGH